MSICLPTTNCSDLIWTPSLIFWPDVYSCTGLSFKLNVKGSWTMITKFKLHAYVRFSPLHWYFVCIEPEISQGYNSITLPCKQWRWDWLLHCLYHQITCTSWVYQLAILSQSELSVIGIICPVTLLQTLNDFKKNELDNFLWTSDWHWNLITVLSYFVDYRQCLSFNQEFIINIFELWL